METTMEELIFSKKLAKTHIYHALDIPIAKLHEFEIPPGEHHVFVPVMDEACMKWRFRLAIRKRGKYRKPVIASTDWLKFVKMNKLRKGDAIDFYKIKNQASGEVIGYEVKLHAEGAIRAFGATIGRK